jgi:von Willebrand factor type A C-terminal domain/von Willebrand factor type A domain
MTADPAFAVEVFQNEYLPEGGREVNAIVTVTATGTPVAGSPAADAAEVIIIDCSGSMDHPSTKLRAAKQATAVAIDALRDGVSFAVIAGTHEARLIYPASGLVPADATTRGRAKVAVATMRADGGTAIGQWLLMANKLFADHPGAIKHAILLTDGRNQHERPDELDRALQACRGAFTCDCRGIGTDWEVAELRTVSAALLGTVDIVAEPSALAADFRAMTAAAMGKRLAEVNMRLWTPQGAVVRLLKQVAPGMLDLSDRRTETGPRTADYPTGSWGVESRDYHLRVEVQPAGVGDRMLAARVSMVVPDGDETVLAQGRVLAVWTDDEALSTRINREVAHHTGQSELAEAIQQGLAARRAGDVETATAKLGRAVALATRLGNEGTASLLAKVVEVEDPVTGTVRLRSRVASVDEMTLDTRSTRTARVKKP